MFWQAAAGAQIRSLSTTSTAGGSAQSKAHCANRPLIVDNFKIEVPTERTSNQT
jgi:hypothetical protein